MSEDTMVSPRDSSKSGRDTPEVQTSPSASSHVLPVRKSRHNDTDTERTRLLPRRQHSDGYLDPDDPAVSPYNLWPIRALRRFAVLFFMITLVWWALLLVSFFFSIPRMQSRGSGFLSVSFTTVTLGSILVELLFFVVPSTPMGELNLVVSILLLVDMTLMLAVTRLRVEEGFVGVSSVIWTAFVGLYIALTNRMVRWGKAEEEERLTGRKETRRSLREWCEVFIATSFLAIYLLVTILLTATLVLRSIDATLPPPGKRYFVNGERYEVHLACVGDHTFDSKQKPLPTVLIEGGYQPVEDSFQDWVHDAYRNGTIDRYCYYDRAGLGWSDNAPSPHSAGMSADALSEALATSGESGPWILVSAGIGGIYSRVFSSRHVRDVKGIMLIDSLHEDLLYKIASPSRGFVLWGRGIISPLGLDRLPGAIFHGRTKEDRVYGKSAYQGGKFIQNKLQENLVANSLTKSEVVNARNIQTRDVPLVVVSSGIHMRQDKDWEIKQEDLTKITDELVAWDVVSKAPPEEVWRTLEGRIVLEKRLGELYSKWRK